MCTLEQSTSLRRRLLAYDTFEAEPLGLFAHIILYLQLTSHYIIPSFS
jgi:hypothetical protein